MHEPVQRRVLKVTSIGGISFVLSAGLGFVSVPICLHAWGPDRYGTWLALQAGFLMLRTIDNGYLGYVGNEINVLFHADKPRMRRGLASAFPVSLGLGLLQVAIWSMLAGTHHLQWLLGVGDASVARYELASALGVLIIAWTLSGSYIAIVTRILVPIGLMHHAGVLALVLQLSQTAAVMVAAELRATVLHAAALYAGVQVVVSVATAIYLRRKASEFYPWWRGPDVSTGVRDLGRSLALTASGLGQQATLSGSVLLVTSAFGASIVPLFTTTRTLSNLWGSLNSVLANALVPDLARYHSTAEPDKLFKAFQAQWFFGNLGVSATMLLFLPFAEAFYTRWTRGLRWSWPLFLLMLSSVCFTNFGSALNVYLYGINNLRSQVVTTTVRAALVFALSFALVPSLGLEGVGIALLVAELVCSVVLALYFVNAEFVGFGTRLPTRSVALALAAMLPIQLLTFEGLVLGHVRVLSLAVGAAMMAGIGWLNWRALDVDVRQRALHLLGRHRQDREG
jgi:O-antigen/teichoic acid export membrane protein